MMNVAPTKEGWRGGGKPPSIPNSRWIDVRLALLLPSRFFEWLSCPDWFFFVCSFGQNQAGSGTSPFGGDHIWAQEEKTSIFFLFGGRRSCHPRNTDLCCTGGCVLSGWARPLAYCNWSNADKKKDDWESLFFFWLNGQCFLSPSHFISFQLPNHYWRIPSRESARVNPYHFIDIGIILFRSSGVLCASSCSAHFFVI